MLDLAWLFREIYGGDKPRGIPLLPYVPGGRSVQPIHPLIWKILKEEADRELAKED